VSLTASAHSVPGTLRQEVLIDGRHRLLTDEPESVGGGGSAPAPHELFPAALAACVSTTIVMYARTKSWPVETVEVDVDYDHQATPRRFTIDIRLTGDLSAEQVERLESVAAKCPVRRAVESGIVFDEHIELKAAPTGHAA
jgi:putative redox protein